MQIIDTKQFVRVSRQFMAPLDSIQRVHTIGRGKLKVDLMPKTKKEVPVSGDRVLI